jgi:hypothetical protein
MFLTAIREQRAICEREMKGRRKRNFEIWTRDWDFSQIERDKKDVVIGDCKSSEW